MDYFERKFVQRLNRQIDATPTRDEIDSFYRDLGFAPVIPAIFAKAVARTRRAVHHVAGRRPGLSAGRKLEA